MEALRETTVFIGSIPAGRERTYLVRCSGCGGGYHLAARTMREMKAAGRDPLCRTCRRPDGLVNVTAAHVAWATAALAEMTSTDRALVAAGLGSIPLK